MAKGTVMAPAPAPNSMLKLQGQVVPAESVDPVAFFAQTRRQTNLEAALSFNGSQPTLTTELIKSDILAGIQVRFVGSITINIGTGGATSTFRWPYDLIANAQLAANGQTNLLSASGAKFKAREMMKAIELTDRGVAQTWGAASVTQGTLSQAAESWGIAPGAVLASGTYNVDLNWYLPVAEDEVDLAGALFLQTSTNSVVLTLTPATIAQLVTLTGDATASISGTFQISAVRFDIPVANGHIIIPDLRVFHSFVQNQTQALSTGGANRIPLPGQGIGKSLLRVFGQTWNGAPSAQLAVNDTTYGQIGWIYGAHNTPDVYASGGVIRHYNERWYNADIGRLHGFWSIDFARENAFRDVVDLGAVTDLSVLVGYPSGLVLTNPVLEWVAETMFVA